MVGGEEYGAEQKELSWGEDPAQAQWCRRSKRVSMSAVEDLFARLKAEAASRGPGWLEGWLAAALGESSPAASAVERESARGRRTRPPTRFLPDAPIPVRTQAQKGRAGRPVSGPPAKRLAARHEGGQRRSSPPVAMEPGREEQRDEAGRSEAGPLVKRTAAVRSRRKVNYPQLTRSVEEKGQQGRAERTIQEVGMMGHRQKLSSGSNTEGRRASRPIADAGEDSSGPESQALGRSTAGAGLQHRMDYVAAAGRAGTAVGDPTVRD